MKISLEIVVELHTNEVFSVNSHDTLWFPFVQALMLLLTNFIQNIV